MKLKKAKWQTLCVVGLNIVCRTGIVKVANIETKKKGHTMQKILLVITIIFSTSALARMERKLFEAQVNENKTYFQTLGEMYKDGTKPDISKLVNLAWSGRCFTKEEQDLPINAGLMYREKSLPDAGPIGNGIKKYEGASYWSQSKPANYYDDLSVDEIMKLHNHKITFFDVKFLLISLELTFSNVRSRMRMSGEYLVEDLTSTQSDVGPIGEDGEAVVRCYYFKSKAKH